MATLIRIVGPCYISNNPILSKFKKSHLCRSPSNRIHIFYTNLIKNPVFIFFPGLTKTADRRVAQTEGVAAQQMEKAEQAKQFDKQTNKQTQKQTNKLDKKEA